VRFPTASLIKVAVMVEAYHDKSPGVDNQALVTGARLSRMVYDHFNVSVRR
jgi:hypothetical protein